MLRTRVKVGVVEPTTRVDFALPVPGSLVGRVTGGSPARALGGSCVLATPKTGHGAAQEALHRLQRPKYGLGGLAPGKYRVEFIPAAQVSSGGFGSQWFDHKATSARATPVASDRKTIRLGVDARLAADGEISGSVRVAGKLRAGVCALAFPSPVGKIPTMGVTNAKGRYLISGLTPAGTWSSSPAAAA